MNIKVLEDDDLEYALINTDTNGIFINKIRKTINLLAQDILDSSFQKTDIRDILLNYIFEKYESKPEFPWEKNPRHATLKTKKTNKWYAVFMTIEKEKLGIKEEGQLDLLNLKLPTTLIDDLIDYKQYFPAYHMNKNHWISIILDRNTDLDYIKNLIHMSYSLAN